MKKIITICLLIVSLFICCSTADAKTYKYVGKIGPYDVIVTLKETYDVHSNAIGAPVTGIEGSYKYVKAGNSLKLKGECGFGNLDGTFLDEYTPKGKNSARWEMKGYIVGDKIMKGIFTNLTNGKKFSIYLNLKK